MQTTRLQKISLLLALIFASINLSALESDHAQPIEIQANSAEVDEKVGVTIYRGDVLVTQGSIQIIADKVTLKSLADDGSAERELQEMIATGKPVIFAQELDNNDGRVKAEASAIRYIMNEDIVQLINNASLQKQEHKISGDRIDYDIKAQNVKARGQVNSSKPQRVTVIIPPKSERDDNDKPAENNKE